LHNSQSNTGSQAGTTTRPVGVQGFAAGALISAPTLAWVGEEHKREAILPLDDERAMTDIGEAVGKHGGSGGMHVHFHGPVIGASDVANLTKTISKHVASGKATLTASNSLRLTKRSA
jgi:hypothetical protein